MLKRKLYTTLSPLALGLLVGSLNPAIAQDAVADPFADTSNTAASPFQPSFGAPEVADPFAAAMDAPAAAPAAAPTSPLTSSAGDPFSAPTDNPFGAPTAAPSASVADPFAAAASGDAPAAAPPSTITAGDPFADAPVDPTAAAPAAAPPADGGNPFGLPSFDISNPFGLPAANTTAETGDATTTGKGISRVRHFRFQEMERPDRTRAVIRRALWKEEAEAFDATLIEFYEKLIADNKVPAYTPIYDANDWAQWMLYAYQLELWQKYVENIVLVGTSWEESDVRVQFPGDAAAKAATAAGATAGAGGGAAGGGGREEDGGGRAQRPANIYNENRSLDDQLQDFNPLADTRPGGQGRTVFSPDQMDEQAVNSYLAYEEVLRTHEEDQVAFVRGLIAELDRREIARQQYNEWRENQLVSVMEFVNDWTRRYEGRVVTIAGVRYELYQPDNAPLETTRGANIVITDGDLTPYDILNSDGTLRNAAE